MFSRNLRRAGALALSVGSVAGVSGAEIEPLGNPVPGYTPSTVVTQLDNPRVLGSQFLPGDEFSWRTGTAVSHQKSRFDQEVSCAFGDRLCIAETTLGPRTVLEGKLQNGTFDFESFGAKIGYRVAVIEFLKTDSDRNISVVETNTAVLDIETIVVPVHVMIEIPRDVPGPSGSGYYMERFASALEYRSLFDRNFVDETTVSEVSHPGEVFGGVEFQWIQDPSNTMVTLGGLTEFRPDDIWSQCGIQFRLQG